VLSDRKVHQQLKSLIEPAADKERSYTNYSRWTLMKEQSGIITTKAF
jgi:hypothetical protein